MISLRTIEGTVSIAASGASSSLSVTREAGYSGGYFRRSND
jgi:hypothetical protein